MSKVQDDLRRILVVKCKERAFATALAEKTGLSQAMLSRLINGTRRMGLYSAEKIADALGYKVAIVPKRKKRGS
jgi:transcriptional regulator with XRE-family HTH domain